jgi:hypothetical protein
VSVVSRDSCDPITAEQRDELWRRYPSVERLDVAFRLAVDVDTCADLLLGQPVERGRLDAKALRWARVRRLVRLERPLDLFDIGSEVRA